ncbi:MAG: hypothetical protein OXC26_01105 [Albidovulum sp.]|nr:hypothetical protein [Albidovulum sp.]
MADLTANLDIEQFCCSAVAAAEDGTLLRWFCEEGYNSAHNHFGEVCNCLTDFHNKGRIDFFDCLLNGELAALERKHFWTIHILFNAAAPKMNTNADKLMTAVILLVNNAGRDGLADQPKCTFKEWLKRRPDETRELLDQLLEPTSENTGLLTSVLEAGASHDLACYHKAAVVALSDCRDSVRSSAIAALSRIDPTENIDCHLRGLDALCQQIRKSDTEREIALAVAALLDVYARVPGRERESVMEAVKSAVAKESPELQCHLAGALISHHKALSKDLQTIIIEALGRADPSNKVIVKQIDLAFFSCLSEDNREAIADCLQALLSHPEAPLSFSDFYFFLDRITSEMPEVTGWLVLRWLRFGNHHARQSLPILTDRYRWHNCKLDFPVDLFGFSDEELTFVCRKALGYFVLEAETAASILVACLQSASSDKAANEITDLIFDPLMINFSGQARKLVECKAVKGTPRLAELKLALKKHDEYIDGLKSVSEVPELWPSPSNSTGAAAASTKEICKILEGSRVQVNVHKYSYPANTALRVGVDQLPIHGIRHAAQNRISPWEIQNID